MDVEPQLYAIAIRVGGPAAIGQRRDKNGHWLTPTECVAAYNKERANRGQSPVTGPGYMISITPYKGSVPLEKMDTSKAGPYLGVV
jgi:hypothetical protein